MRYVRLLIPAAVLLLLVLAGCGNDEAGREPPSDSTVAGAPAEPAEKPGGAESPAPRDDASAGAGGVPAPESAGGDKGVAASPDKDRLQHRRFLLSKVNGIDFTAKDPRPEFEFLEGFRIAGSMCNRFTGQAELADGVLKAEQVAFTRMLCADSDLNRLDTRFGEMMTTGMRVVFDGKTLTLSDEDTVLEYALNELVQ